jgi:HSP20 family protein
MRFGLTRWNPARVARWDPFDEMRQMQNQINDMIKEMSLGEKWSESDTLAPLVDVKDEGNTITVATDLPGVDKKDVDIDIRDNVISISARCGRESESMDEGYARRERTYSMFSRTVTLPKQQIEDKQRILIAFSQESIQGAEKFKYQIEDSGELRLCYSGSPESIYVFTYETGE